MKSLMKSLTKEKWYDLIDAFNSTSRYLDDLLNIDNIHFEHMVHRIYPAELQLNKANASDTEAALNLSIYNDIVSTKIYDKRDDFNFHIVNFPSFMAMSLDVPLMVYIYLSLFTLPEHLRMLLTSITRKFKKIIGFPNFSYLFKGIAYRFKRAGYTLDIMRQTSCLVFNPIMVEGYAAFFSCMAVVQTSDSMTASM